MGTSTNPVGIPLGTPVMVDWLDASADGSWCDVSEISTKPEKVRSLGYLIRVNRQVLVIAADVDANTPTKGDVNRSLVIPIGMVTRVKRVR